MPGLFIFCLVCFGTAQYSTTNELLSNDIYWLDGSGDTLWMVSSKGVNYTTSITDSPTVIWSGFRDFQAWPPTYGGGFTLIRTTEDYNFYKSGVPDKLWIFNIADKSQRFVALPFSNPVHTGNDTLLFQAADAIWFKDAFWIACMNGGLFTMQGQAQTGVIFYPGRDKVVYNSNTFNEANFPTFHDSTYAISVAHDDSLIWVTCLQKVWQFNPDDTTWTTIAPATGVTEYLDIEVRMQADTAVAFVIASKNDKDTTLFRYNNGTNQWSEFSALKPLTVELSDENHVYMIYESQNNSNIHLYLDTLANSSIQTTPYRDERAFNTRVTDVIFSSFIPNDIHFATYNQNKKIFAIATDQGLFYSTNAHADEEAGTPFKHQSRRVPLDKGLEKTYAIPGIINNYLREIRTEFAYNLSEDDHVSIDIYDYNMDHVVCIVDEVPRKAGSSRTSGRSTIPSEDFWDGTVNNNGGRIVAPGVYFYRIKTKKGSRAFGKIIVARN